MWILQRTVAGEILRKSCWKNMLLLFYVFLHLSSLSFFVFLSPTDPSESRIILEEVTQWPLPSNNPQHTHTQTDTGWPHPDVAVGFNAPEVLLFCAATLTPVGLLTCCLYVPTDKQTNVPLMGTLKIKDHFVDLHIVTNLLLVTAIWGFGLCLRLWFGIKGRLR